MVVSYLLCGNNNNENDEIKIERFMVVEESELDDSKKFFNNLISKEIYSVGVTKENAKYDEIDPYFIDTNIPSTKDEIMEIQKLTYIINPNVELRMRTPRRKIEVTPVQNDNKSGNEKVDNKPKFKPILNTNKRKQTSVKQSKLTSTFSKAKKEKIEEPEEEPDPFASEDEDEKKDDSDLQNDSDEKEKPEEANDKSKKRPSKESSDEDDDEGIFPVKKNKNKNNKKFKRIRMISDSESENENSKSDKDDDEEIIVKKCVREEKPKTIKKKVVETHMDEDGFMVTKTVMKEIPADHNLKDDHMKNDNFNDGNLKNDNLKDDKVEEETNNKNGKNKKESKSSKKDDTKTKKDSNKSNKNPKPKTTKSQSKSQASIMDFFKRKD